MCQSRLSRTLPPAGLAVGGAASDAPLRGKRATALVLSLGVHGLAAGVLLMGAEAARTTSEPPVVMAELVPWATLTPAAAPAKASPAHKKTPPPRPKLFRKAVLKPSAVFQNRAAVHQVNFGPGLSETTLAEAAQAGSGNGGGACNMAVRLQSSLLSDFVAQTALANLGGRTILVWNGAWVRFDGEDGNGLSAVREALMWDIAFAPKNCQDEAVHGLIVLRAGRGRIAIGRSDWRWGELVTRHSAIGAGDP